MNHLLKTNFSHEGLRKGRWGRWPGKIWSEIRTATFLRSHYIHLNTVAKHKPPQEKKKQNKTTKQQSSHIDLRIYRTMSNTVSFIPKVFREGALGLCFSKDGLKKIVIYHSIFSSVIIKKGCMKEVKRKAAGMCSFDFTSRSSTQKILHLTKQAHRSI